MERATAIAFLQDLHRAQRDFYAGGPPDRLRELLAPDVAWHVPGTSPIAGEHRGADAVLEYMTRRRAIADATFRMHMREILVGTGDHLAALTDGTAVIGGRERRWSTAGVYRLRDGRLAECRLLPFDQAEFDAIWSAAA
jgi:ketosteroid isomerase-like protein